MPHPITGTIAKACSTSLWLAAALTIAAPSTQAQFLDPPLGWDVWDPTWPDRDVWEKEDQDQAVRWRVERHNAYIDQGVSDEFRGANNPLPRIPSVLDAGGSLYQEHCASCHDATGQGHGEAGLTLYPSPALLAHLVRLPSRVDEYLLWTIAEGGGAFETEMPAFKDVLEIEQIWQIITYMRAGFPAVGGNPEK